MANSAMPLAAALPEGIFVSDYIIAFDIETIRRPDTDDYFKSKVYKAPGNLKDPEKIRAAIDEKRKSDYEDAALYWWLNQVVCITAIPLLDPDRAAAFYGDDEKKLLCDFFNQSFAWNSTPRLVGKSSKHFDEPVLVGRSLARDIGIPEFLRTTQSPRDVDDLFAFSSQCSQRSTLSNYAYGLGISGKIGRGDDVAQWHAEATLGNADKWGLIAAYCLQDSKIVAEMMRRWMKPYVSKDCI